MRFLAYPLFLAIDGWWLLLDGYTKHTSRTPLTKDIEAELRRLYPEIAEEIIAREGEKRGFAGQVRRKRLIFIALGCTASWLAANSQTEVNLSWVVIFAVAFIAGLLDWPQRTNHARRRDAKDIV